MLYQKSKNKHHKTLSKYVSRAVTENSNCTGYELTFNEFWQLSKMHHDIDHRHMHDIKLYAWINTAL